MADPRAAVSFQIGPHPGQVVTIEHDDTITYSAAVANGSAQVGLAVSIESDGVVTLAGAGENVFGKLLKVESDGFASVQIKGWMTLPGGDSAVLTAGLHIVGALGVDSVEGYIAVATAGTAADHVISRGFIYDATTTTAVIVYLE